MKTTKKRIGITNKKRFTAFLAIVLILTCCGFSSVKSYVSGGSQVEWISVFVAPGDTLWNIAAANNPGNRDLRTLVHEIKKYNGLSSNTIHAGDKLVIPV